jgi:NitT/TauT family transport system substrate-binding protein
MRPPLVLNRRVFGGVLTLAAASLAAPVVRAQAPLERSTVSIAVGGKATFYYLPLTIAEQLGYFKAEGLEVQILDFQGGARALQAFVDGGADVCSGAFEHTLRLQSRGMPVKAFVLQGRAPQVVVGVSHRTLPGYKGLASLRGRRIGVSAPGSSTDTVCRLLLARAGLAMSDINTVPVGVGSTALAALRSGSIDALSSVDPVMTMLAQKNEVRVVADTRTLRGSAEVFGGPMPAGCLFAATAFIQKNPRTVQAMTNAIVRALKWLQTAGPSDLLQAVPESYQLGDRALYLAAFGKMREAISPDGLLPDEGPRTALRALAVVDASIQPERMELARLYTNEFARRARDLLKA